MQLSLDQSNHGLTVTDCANALDVSRATAYRRLRPEVKPQPELPTKRRSHRALDEQERATLLDIMDSDRFLDQPPREILGALLKEGTYLASVSTMYRLLREHGQTLERRSQRAPVHYQAPAVRADRPNAVWVWDITRLPGPRAGVWFYVYSILDLYSRFVVGWMVAENENAINAEHLFAITLDRYHIEPGTLVVHSDRGAPMTSSLLQDSFITHGVAPSFSRPQVSNDNPHAEASFRTMKAQPDILKRFPNAITVRQWVGEHMDWSNHEHHHVALALMTPADVYFGRVNEVMAFHQAGYDKIYEHHPERFPKGRPMAKPPPMYVDIDPGGVHAYGDGWHDTSPLNPLTHLQKHPRSPQPSRQKLLKF
jgi:putative transposase